MIKSAAAILIVLSLVLAVSHDPEADDRTRPQPAAAAAPDSAANSLAGQLTAMDAKLFNAIFNDCDTGALQGMLTDDFEFYHDRGGLVATNAVQFIRQIQENCERQKSGQATKSRREPLPRTFEFYSLNNYGAIHSGSHRFYILNPGKPETPGDIAKFTHLWKKDPTGWKLARVVSFDHKTQ